MLSPRLLGTLASVFILGEAGISAAAPAPVKPKLVVGIIIDQFRYDYLTRFRADYHGGLHQLMTEGADFTNAFYAQAPTKTAVGHSIFMSGAMPAVSGIVSNSWYDRTEEKVVTSVCDWKEKTVGGRENEQPAKQCQDSDPASPRRMLVTTVGDELMTVDSKSKVIGVSLKPRAAILPSGHRAAGAYWFDDAGGKFVTSTYYMQELPAWASKFNGQNFASKYIERKWDGFPSWDFHASAGSKTPYSKLEASPWGNELIEQFAEQALTGEELGRRGATDLLTVSFSSNDYVGHRAGPDSPEVKDMAVRTDQLLAKLFRLIDQRVGLKNTIIVLSADHGVAPVPNREANGKMPGGYLPAVVNAKVTDALNKRFGKKDWIISGGGETNIYLNEEAVESAKSADGTAATRTEVLAEAKRAILRTPELHVARVYSNDQLDNGVDGDFITRAAMNGYYPRRSSDLFIFFDPYFVTGSSGAEHFSPYAYDRHVPVLFLGPGIKAGEYNDTIAPNDIAPTLATLLSVQTPSGSSGRVLTEMLIH